MKLQNGEHLLKQQDNAVWVRGKFNNVVGKLILTNQRLAFEQRSVIRSAILSQFGIVGDITDAVTPRNIVVNLPLGQLASFSRLKVVSSRKVIPITTKSGEEFLFSGPKFEQWAPVLMQVGLFEAGQAASAPPNLPQYGQQLPYGQQPAYSVVYAPPLPQAPSKKGIPWWGWLLIAIGIIFLACGAVTIVLFVIGSTVGSTTLSSVAAML